MEMGGNLMLILETKMWEFCMSKHITFIAKYFLVIKNTKTDQASWEAEIIK